MLIERAGETRKLLLVILPLGMQLAPGTRVILDRVEPMNAPCIICFASGCISDYEASDELLENMKRSERLVVQAVNGQDQAISLTLPLKDFGKAYDSPPSDPKAFEAQQGKLHNGLERRAEEVRQKLEGHQP